MDQVVLALICGVIQTSFDEAYEAPWFQPFRNALNHFFNLNEARLLSYIFRNSFFNDKINTATYHNVKRKTKNEITSLSERCANNELAKIRSMVPGEMSRLGDDTSTEMNFTLFSVCNQHKGH